MNGARPPAACYRLGDFELDIAARRLRRGDGTPIHLANRPFKVLAFLVANRERLVTRAELLDAFWSGRHVYDDSLTRCVSSVRKALGDRDMPPHYIETRWGEGYRFVGPCEERDASAPSTRRASRRSSDRADELYRLGLYYHGDYSRRGQRYALSLFTRIVDADPEHARAWAGIAWCHALLCLYAGGTDENRRTAAEATERALELDPTAAEAHIATAQLAVVREDHAAAEAAFLQAEELDPKQFFAWLCHARSRAVQGDHERAVELYEHAARVSPHDYQALALAEQSYRRLGLYKDAKRAAERSVAAGERVLAARPDDVRAMSLTSCLLPLLNRHVEAQGWTERACFLEPGEPFVNVNAACVHIERNELDRALDFLERVPATPANRRWIAHDATLDPLRDLPRFDAYMRG